MLGGREVWEISFVTSLCGKCEFSDWTDPWVPAGYLKLACVGNTYWAASRRVSLWTDGWQVVGWRGGVGVISRGVGR